MTSASNAAFDRQPPQNRGVSADANPNTRVALTAALTQALMDSATHSAALQMNAELIQSIIQNALDTISKLPHPYHNRNHTERVLTRAEEFGLAAGLSEHDLALLKVAAAYHDFGHCGSTYRQLVRGAERADLSNEEFAAICADQALAHLLSPLDRLLVQGMILATAFGQRDIQKLPPENAEKLYRPYKPTSNLEKLLAFADVSNFLDGFDTFIRDNINVIRESGLTGIPRSFEEFLTTRLMFLDYVQAKLSDIIPMLDAAEAQRLGGHMTSLREELSTMRAADYRDSGPWAIEFNRARLERIEELES